MSDAGKAYGWLSKRYPDMSEQDRLRRARGMAGAAAAHYYNTAHAQHPGWGERKLVSYVNKPLPDSKPIPENLSAKLRAAPESGLEASYHLPSTWSSLMHHRYHPVAAVKSAVSQGKNSAEAAMKFNEIVNSVPESERQALYANLGHLKGIISKMPKGSIDRLLGTLESGVNVWNRFDAYRKTHPWVNDTLGFVSKHPWWSAGIGIAGLAGTSAALQGAAHAVGRGLLGRSGSSLNTYGLGRW